MEVMIKRFTEVADKAPIIRHIKFEQSKKFKKYCDPDIPWAIFCVIGGFSMTGPGPGEAESYIIDLYRKFATREIPADDRIEFIIWSAYWSDYLLSPFCKLIALQVIEDNLPDLEKQNFVSGNEGQLLDYAKANWKTRDAEIIPEPTLTLIQSIWEWITDLFDFSKK